MKKELEAYDRIATYLALNFDIDSEMHKDCLIIQQTLTPPTANEIVKELREIYPTKTRQYEIEFENKKYRISDDEFKNGIYVVKLQQLPLKLAHKITSFFMEISNE